MYSGERHQNGSLIKHKRQLRDSIIQWSVYKCSLLINIEVNTLVQYRIDRTDDEFVIGLRAKGVSSQRDASTIFLQITPLNTSRASILITIVHTLRGQGKYSKNLTLITFSHPSGD